MEERVMSAQCSIRGPACHGVHRLLRERQLSTGGVARRTPQPADPTAAGAAVFVPSLEALDSVPPEDVAAVPAELVDLVAESGELLVARESVR